jgi:type II secretory pathway pseudopilin PulG
MERGTSLAEMAVVVALGALFAAIALPALPQIRSRTRTAAAAREVVALFRRCRSEAVARSRTVAVQFTHPGSRWLYAMYEDSDGDGISSSDIASGDDRRLGGPWGLGDHAPGVEFSILPVAPIRKIPPQSGSLTNPTDPIQFGSSDLVSFTPLGASTSGTAYLSDGERMYGIVVSGASARCRIWRYLEGENLWVQ